MVGEWLSHRRESEKVQLKIADVRLSCESARVVILKFKDKKFKDKPLQVSCCV
jgi:hypothetical protein